MNKRDGFTLIEMMIVVGVIALIAAIAIPNLLAAQMAAQEVSAISTLRSITYAQSQFKAAAVADVDGDKIGEFGMFRELSAAVAVRVVADGAGGTKTIEPPVLPGAFQTMNANFEISRAGYLFKMFLPGTAGVAVGESEGAAAFTAAVDSNLVETHWCCYGWPASHGNSGSRTFFVNQSGAVTTANLEAYSGTGSFNPENAGRAFRAGGPLSTITGVQAVGTKARDGETWELVN